MTVRAVGLIVAATVPLVWAAPTLAQFGFGNLFDPPRPPSSVPTRQPPPQQPPPPQYQPPPPQYQPPAPQGRIQGEDLPPPGGGEISAMPPPPSAGVPPGQRPPQQQQRPGTPPGATAAIPAPGGFVPAAATTVTPPETFTPPPPQRIANPMAAFSGLDKITGRITTFEAAIGETVQFGALQVTARACYSRPPTETPLTDGFVEVDEVTLQGEVRRIFTGWMFAASPGLHAVEHPIYDVWLTDCKGAAPAVADVQPPAPAAPAAPAAKPPSAGQQRAPAAQRSQNAPPPRQSPPAQPR